NVPFGAVRGTVEMRDGAFWFHGLQVAEGDAGLTLDGMARFKPVAGKSRLDLAVASHAFPLPRLLRYLELDFPIQGKITGNFKVTGTPPDAVSGGGPIELADAVVYGQKFPLVTGSVRLEPDRFEIDDLRAELGGGTVRGEGALATRATTSAPPLA